MASQVPAHVPVALDIFEANGYSQKQVAGASSAMFTIVICTGNALGPPLGGLLIQLTGGLPTTATIYFCLAASVAVPLNAILVCQYWKRPAQGCVARGPTVDGAAEDQAGAKEGPGLATCLDRREVEGGAVGFEADFNAKQAAWQSSYDRSVKTE